MLGVGVGSLAEEFALLGAPFDDRGARADDAMRALRAALSQTGPSTTEPSTTSKASSSTRARCKRRCRLWVGGRTARSLRRAVELGDGWAPFGLSSGRDRDDGRARLARPRRGGRTEPLDVVLQNEHPLDPLAEPERVAEQVGRLVDAGATALNVRFVHHSPRTTAAARGTDGYRALSMSLDHIASLRSDSPRIVGGVRTGRSRCSPPTRRARVVLAHFLTLMSACGLRVYGEGAEAFRDELIG